MPKYLIEIRGKLYASHAGQVVMSEIIETNSLDDAACQMAKRWLADTAEGKKWSWRLGVTDLTGFWFYNYYDWVEV